MLIKFLMDDVKDMSYLYSITKMESDHNTEMTVQHYTGGDYCKAVLETVCDNVKFLGRENISYLGSLGRIANETFKITSHDGLLYKVCFTIDTYGEKIARMEVSVSSEEFEGQDYDHQLEELKIALKDRLLVDWGSCTWLIDDQSTRLCKEAFEKASVVENELRAFVSKVLILYLGINWIKNPGLEKIDESVQNLAEKYTNSVPEFRNINTDFLSMTLETLSAVLFEGVIYDQEVRLSNKEYLELQRICNKNGASAGNVAEYLKKRRQPVAKLWDKYFVQFFDDSDSLKKAIHDFIEDRNHVAHSKVLSWNAYGIMLKDFEKMELLLEFANEKYEEIVQSEEIIDTREAMEENQFYEQQYHRERVEMETGMDILSEEAILEWFDKVIYELYSDIYQRYHLDVEFEVSDYYHLGSNYMSFYVSCPVEDDRTLTIKVSAEWSIDDELSADSTCVVSVCSANEDIIDSAEIYFHNGNGSEGENGLMEATDNTEYDASEIDGLKEMLIDAIENLNPYPAKLQALEYDSKGAERYVSDYPCEQCGKMGISIREDFLPIGKCCYCGYEHEMENCFRCDELVSIGEMINGFCPACKVYIDEQ